MSSLRVLQAHELLVGPVKVVSNEGYLLAQLLEGVADYPPN